MSLLSLLGRGVHDIENAVSHAGHPQSQGLPPRPLAPQLSVQPAADPASQGYTQNDLSQGLQGGTVNQGFIPLQNGGLGGPSATMNQGAQYNLPGLSDQQGSDAIYNATGRGNFMLDPSVFGYPADNTVQPNSFRNLLGR